MRYELIRSRRKTVSAQVKDGKLVVRAPLFMSRRDIDAFLEMNSARIERMMEKARARERELAEAEKLTEGELADLVKRGKEVFPERAAHYARLIGVDFGRISVRKQRTRWGSCSPKGDLSFNCLLLLAPPEVLDSVVVHELCHRKRMDHSKRFYDEVLRVFPDYRECRKWLNEHGPKLLAKLEK